MTHHWDEFSKSLAEKSVPRRESLRLLGAALAGALLGPLAGRTALAAGPDPCKKYCNQYPRWQRSSCLAACQACSGDTSRICGSDGSFSCCPGGKPCCNGYCTDLASDFDHCGACGNPCPYPGPYEDGACVDGQCFYWCVEGAADCGDGICTDLLYDPDNCGACGNVCGGAMPLCFEGACRTCEELGGTYCDGECINLLNDPYNCGACGHVCNGDEDCVGGVCQRTCIPDCGPGSTHGASWCGDDGCGGRCACTGVGEYCPAYSNWCAVSEPTPF